MYFENRFNRFLQLLILIISVGVITSCQPKSRTIINKTNKGTIESLFFYPDRQDSTTCEIELYYPDGEIMTRAKMVKNRYVGRIVNYYVNGQISQIDSLSNPCDTSEINCDGTFLRFHQNGKLATRYFIKNHQMNGLVQQYLKTGDLAKEFEVSNNNIRNGIYREFNDKGIKYFEGHFRNDILVGLAYFFEVNGDSLKYYNNINGSIDLPYKKWLPDRTTIVGNYSSDKKYVEWVWFDKKNRIIKSKKYLFSDTIVIPEK